MQQIIVERLTRDVQPGTMSPEALAAETETIDAEAVAELKRRLVKRGATVVHGTDRKSVRYNIAGEQWDYQLEGVIDSDS